MSQSQEKWKRLLGATPTCDITHGREKGYKRDLARRVWDLRAAVLKF